jgi:hypothetical protein
VRYYYLPDVEAYYDVQSRMFIYYGGGVWVHRASLPSRYRGYDLFGGYKVVMTGYHGSTPYKDFKQHKMKYSKGYRGETQRTNGERPGKGNPGSKDSHGGNGYGESEKHGNNQGNSHGNNQNKNENSGHGNGNGKKK